jgi:hypothetical protein
MSYLKPNITISIVDDFSKIPARAVPPQYKTTFEPVRSPSVLPPFLSSDNDNDGLAAQQAALQAPKQYYPHVWFNDFWILRDYLVPVNSTLKELPIEVEVGPISAMKFMLFSSVDQSFATQREWGMQSEGEADEVKRIFLEGNPWLLALTTFVSLLHSIFDALAFKNDIGFWKDNKSMRGLSARTVLINAFCQAIIFLYLLDNETSLVVLASSGIGAAIEFWKVTKAMKVTLVPSARLFGLPIPHFADRDSYTSSKTDEYDAEAMRYLSYALYPLIIGYAIYTLKYETHRSWYSWAVSSLVGAVYTFGFILMCPQLYLNYKLKSVAHLPWRQMTYKFLNTIIDDLFAFVIKMPIMHRLSVFRDDLIFLIYVYQRWIYRVDKTRANEFGYVEERETETETEGEAAQGDGAPVAAAEPEAEAPVERKKDK